MKKSVGWCAVAVAVLMLAAVPALAEDKSDLAGRAAMWVKRFNAGDDAGVAALYTEDAVRMPYQAPTLKGHDEILAGLATGRGMGATNIEIKVVEGDSQGNMAWGRGTYALKGADGAVIQSGKWMNVSVKVGGEWKIHRDIWNTDAPAE